MIYVKALLQRLLDWLKWAMMWEVIYQIVCHKSPLFNQDIEEKTLKANVATIVYGFYDIPLNI